MILYNDLPNWQKRGTGLVWSYYSKEGINPKTNECIITKRRKIDKIYDLPLGVDYTDFIKDIICSEETNDY